jgi:hypothetical protein
VKKLLFLSTAVMLVMISCKVEDNTKQQSDIIVINEYDSTDNRPMFTVVLPNGTVHDHMFAEEVAQGLIDGKWYRCEDIRLAYMSEYQVFLEPDSIMIYDFARKVAAVPYNKTGVLDSIFIKDNE